MPTLDEMGRARGMDIAQKDYLRHYHAFLNPWKEMPVKIRELSGDDERMALWADFFPNGEVYGGPEVGFGEPLNYHLILDSSAVSKDQLARFVKLFPDVEPGGYYCIENVGDSLDKANWGGAKRGIFDSLNWLLKDLHAQQFDPEMALTYPELVPYVDFVFTAPGLVVVRRKRAE